MNDELHDREFEDFLRRRRPLFRAPQDQAFEPPADLDRLVLRQAREAIESDQPQRMFRSPGWGAPLAIAATLVLGLAIVFKAGMTPTGVQPQVTVETAAQQVDAAAPAAAKPAPSLAATEAPSASQAAPAASPASPMTAAAAPPAPAPAPASPPAEATPARPAAGMAREMAADAAPAGAAAWRQDSRAWLAEIDRLRAAGDDARADAELAEYNRQHRALAVSPDR